MSRLFAIKSTTNTTNSVKSALGLPAHSTAILLSGFLFIAPPVAAQTKTLERTTTLTTERTVTTKTATKLTAAQTAEIQSLQQYTRTKSIELASLQSSAEAISKTIALRNTEMQAISNQLATLQKSQVKPESTILQLRKSLQSQKISMDALQAEAVKFDSAITSFEKDIESTSLKATATFASIENPPAEVISLQTGFKELTAKTATVRQISATSVKQISLSQQNIIKLQTNLTQISLAASAPLVSDVVVKTASGSEASVSLSSYITDPDNDVNLNSVDLNPEVTGQQADIKSIEGVWSVNEFGVLSFTPVTGFEGAVSTIYTVQDAGGRLSNTASINITVAGAIPTASPESIKTSAGAMASADLSDNVNDANNDIVLSTLDLDPSTPGIQKTISNQAGEWSISENGSLTYLPSEDFEGTASISYVVQDDDGNTSTPAMVAVLVAGATPVANSLTANANPDTNTSVDLSAEVSDNNNDIVIGSIDLNPELSGDQKSVTTTAGVWTVSELGVMTFDPATSFQGSAVIRYTVRDDDGNTSLPASITVSVLGAAPVVTSESATISSGTTSVISLADNFTDANNNALVSSIDINPITTGKQSTLSTAQGEWSVDSAGILQFSPAPGFEGIATLEYTIADSDNLLSDTAVISVTVDGAVPQATSDNTTVASNTTALIDLSDNISDANNDVVISSVDLDPATAGTQKSLSSANGDWAVDSSGTVSYQPVTGFEGTATASYTVSDDDGNVSNTAGITVLVEGALPVATADSTTVDSNNVASIDLSDNVSDFNNDVVLTSIDLDPEIPGIQNSLETTDGSWVANGTGILTFTPAPAFEGSASIPYTVSDDDGNVSADSTITVMVNGAFPVVTAANTTVPSSTTASLDLTGNVSDYNNDITFSSIDLSPTTPGIQQTLSTTAGNWSVSPGGIISFDPAPEFEGIASVPYTIADDDGNTSEASSVSITVEGATPIASNDNTTVASGMQASVDLNDNISDANNDIVINSIDLDPTTTGFQQSLSTPEGSWSVAAGTVTFTPAPGFEGTTAVLYTVEDDDGNISNAAQVSVVVGGATPIATADGTTVNSGNIANIDLKDNVSDANNDVVISTIDLDTTTSGIQQTISTTEGEWSVAAGTVTFTPAAGFEGTATIPYTVEDDDGNVSNVTQLTIDVNGATPIATADGTTVDSGNIATVDLTDNVSDANNDVVISTVDLDTTIPGTQQTLSTAEGVWSVAAGTVTFTPAPGFEGSATIPYTVEDDDGNVSNTAQLAIVVNGAIPIATTDGTTVDTGNIASIDLNDNVSDANNDVVISAIDLDTTIPGTQQTLSTAEGVWSVAAGTVTFTPAPGFEGTATIPYTVEDDDGNVSLASSVSVLVNGASPIATADSTTTGSDTNATVDLTDNISDANNDEVISTIDLDPTTAGTQTTLQTPEGAWSVDAGTVTFDPLPQYEGTASVAYTVSDDDGNLAEASTVSVIVEGAVPIATAESVTVATNVAASIDLTDNVTDANNDVVISSIDLDPSIAGVQTTLTTPEGSWAVSAGTVTFTPTAGFEGTASIPYTVEDDDGNVASTSQVSVTVNGAVPIATADGTTVNTDAVATLDLSDNVSDPNNDVVIASIDLDPSAAGIQQTLSNINGVWTVNDTGSVEFAPNPGFEGVASIPYTITDDDGNVSNPADLSVIVEGATPVVTADSALVATDTDATFNLSDKVTDANNDVVISSIDLNPATPNIEQTLTTDDGLWSATEDGSVIFDPQTAFEGSTNITYTVRDDDDNVSLPASLTVTVAGATPVATDDAVTVLADTNATLDLNDNVSDANDDIVPGSLDLDVESPGTQVTLQTADGVWTYLGAGQVEFDPVASFEGITSTLYNIADDDGNVSAPATISVTVGSAAPMADSESVDGVQDTDAIVDILDGDTDSNNDIDTGSIDLDPSTPGIQSTLAVPQVGEFNVVDGELVFTPEPDFHGVATVDYTITDASGNVSNVATAEINIQSDYDGDGIPDATDIDDDNDGLPDDTETDQDQDADGIPNSLDTDSDNDGLTDTLEAGGTDADGDGIVDGFSDADADGLDDATAGTPLSTPDSDNDSLADYLDLDSDNDGMTDAFETQASDENADGIVDNYTDTDNDGRDDTTTAAPVHGIDSDDDGIPDHLDLDSDNDGLTDTFEAGGLDDDGNGRIDNQSDDNNNGLDDTAETLPLTVADTDGDQVADYLDLDSDNDALTDTVEAGGEDTDGNGLVDSFTDTDNDGYDDATAVLPLPSPDTDADGNEDHLDTDADNDGLTDITEAGGTDSDTDGTVDNWVDADSNGLDDTSEATPLADPDTDGDGANDRLDTDSDADTIPDAIEGTTDSDTDGLPNYLESDSDADSIPDNVEAGSDPTAPADTDADGLPDYTELDSDNDSIPDTTEAGSDPTAPTDTDADGIPDYTELDSDNDSIPDTVEAGTDPTAPTDTDADGIPDYTELDSDNDSIPDTVEAGNDPTIPTDTDADGIPDYTELDSDNDNIPDTIEAGTDPTAPTDTDADGIPDYTELDSDNDGIPDTTEAGNDPTAPADTDADGIPDYIELDSDSDNIPDSVEAGADPTSPADTDADGTPDVIDTDSDNDRVPDAVEAGGDPSSPTDTDADGIPDYRDTDSDNDSIPDFIEAGANPLTPIDTDADGIADLRELDSDGDSIPDNIEAGSAPDAPRDSDGNGIPDFQEPDSDYDNDGLSDRIEGTVDTDGDSIPDYQDEDSDNDSISDAVEATFDSITPSDKDNDNIPDYIDVDADNDGISDAYEGEADTDGDKVADYRDLDVDNDGIYDIIEARIGMIEVNELDADRDGMIDYSYVYGANGMADFVETDVDSGIENYSLPDIDADNVPDFRDLDSDNDGLFDTFESNHTDTDLDGLIDSSKSLPATRVRTIRAVSQETGLAYDAGGIPPNTDADGLADFRDKDSDNDGLSDVLESFGINADSDRDGVYDDFIDTDGNGANDNAYLSGTAPQDTDLDGNHDAIQLDSDADGISDLIETGGTDIDNNGMLDDFLDLDADGVDDGIAVLPLAVVDTDNDNLPDFQDLDSDNDGLSDILESGGTDANGDNRADEPVIAAALPDADGNDIPDYQEVALLAQLEEPEPAAAIDSGEAGVIRTGLTGQGCTAGGTSSHKDPALPALLLFSLLALVTGRFRSARQDTSKRN